MPSPFDEFLQAKSFAVAGASRDPEKYGYQVFRALLASGRHVFPLNPKAPTIDGHPAFAQLADLPAPPESLSLVTPPAVTRQVVAEAIQAGVKHLWMQPGAEDEQAGRLAREAGLLVIDDGSCILVAVARERPRAG